MENVSMLRSDVHRFYMEEADLDIVEEYQIPNKNANDNINGSVSPLYICIICAADISLQLA